MPLLNIEGRIKDYYSPQSPELLACRLRPVLLEPVMDLMFENLPEYPGLNEKRGSYLIRAAVSPAGDVFEVGLSKKGSYTGDFQQTTTLTVFGLVRVVFRARTIAEEIDDMSGIYPRTALRHIDSCSDPARLAFTQRNDGSVELIALRTRIAHKIEPPLLSIVYGAERVPIKNEDDARCAEDIMLQALDLLDFNSPTDIEACRSKLDVKIAETVS